MSNICRVQYVDAWYTDAENVDETLLLPHEAHGYVEKRGDDIIIIFIKKFGSNTKEFIDAGQPIVKGLVIPNVALISTSSSPRQNLLRNIALNSPIIVTWRDVRYVAHVAEYSSAVMRTQAILHRIEKDHAVFKEPRTTRISPLPHKAHLEGEKPRYLIVPLSFIIDAFGAE